MLYKSTLQIVPNFHNIYKYITGTLDRGQPPKYWLRGERGKGKGEKERVKGERGMEGVKGGKEEMGRELSGKREGVNGKKGGVRGV